MTESHSVLVTGATGYVGGRLVPELLAAGHRVRCLARSPEKLAGHAWASDVEIVRGDVTDTESLRDAMAGCTAAYYLVHSMGGSPDFEQRDQKAAETFRDAASDEGMEQIVYLGGLADETDPNLSRHLRSRVEVGRVLASGPVPVTELRAAMIIGSGSASFEMLRNLVDVLPLMVTPRWVRTRCQPIAIRDVLWFLVAAISEPEASGRILEIGGPDVLTYEQMMQAYADVAKLPRRAIVPVPLLSPGLSSLWIGLVTPLPSGLARPLVDSLINEVVVRDRPATDVLPHDCLSFRQAVRYALRRVENLDVATTWASAQFAGTTPADPLPTDPDWSGGTLLADEQEVHTPADPADVFAVVEGMGGKRGWYSPSLLWEVRGLIDRAFGGVGLRRGRRHPDQLRVGDPADFFRVEALDPPRLLRLRAEMRLPGRAWLEWKVEPASGGPASGGPASGGPASTELAAAGSDSGEDERAAGIDDTVGEWAERAARSEQGASSTGAEGTEGTVLRQRALFAPKGLWGRAYWYGLLPFHTLIFRRMAQAIADTATHVHREDSQPA
jgi:uncharacterized protein YbjT (DUF2867 family)